MNKSKKNTQVKGVKVTNQVKDVKVSKVSKATKASAKSAGVKVSEKFAELFSINGLIKWAVKGDGAKVIETFIVKNARVHNTSTFAASRLSVKGVLSLMTISELNSFKLSEDNTVIVSDKTKFSIEILKRVIVRKLKKSDVFVKFSDLSDSEKSELLEAKKVNLIEAAKEAKFRKDTIEAAKLKK